MGKHFVYDPDHTGFYGYIFCETCNKRVSAENVESHLKTCRGNFLCYCFGPREVEEVVRTRRWEGEGITLSLLAEKFQHVLVLLGIDIRGLLPRRRPVSR